MQTERGNGSLFNFTDVQCLYSTKESDLRSTILSGYDPDIRPHDTTTVTMSLILMSLNTLVRRFNRLLQFNISKKL